MATSAHTSLPNASITHPAPFLRNRCRFRSTSPARENFLLASVPAGTPLSIPLGWNHERVRQSKPLGGCRAISFGFPSVSRIRSGLGEENFKRKKNPHDASTAPNQLVGHDCRQA